MLDAGYDGYLAIEGVDKGDQLSKDGRSLEYVQRLIAEISAAAVKVAERSRLTPAS